MKRYYYISDDLDELEAIELELERNGVVTPQIHVLSKDDAGVMRHRHLNEVSPFLKQDVVHSTLKGALLGVVLAAVGVAAVAATGVAETVGWAPFVCLALAILGFCTWEGGLWGIQEPNSQFARFSEALDAGKHVLFIDADPQQQPIIERVVEAHPKLEAAGTGKGAPRWVVSGQQKAREFVEWAP